VISALRIQIFIARPLKKCRKQCGVNVFPPFFYYTFFFVIQHNVFYYAHWFEDLLVAELPTNCFIFKDHFENSIFSAVPTYQITFWYCERCQNVMQTEPYQPHSIHPNWVGPRCHRGPEIPVQSRHHLQPQRMLRSPKLKY